MVCHHFSKFNVPFFIVILYMFLKGKNALLINDQACLLSFKTRIVSDPKHALQDWNVANGLHVCNWTGIACDAKRENVIELNLKNYSLKGTISPILSNLSYLSILDLTGNFFEGNIPAELGSLIHLREVSLSTNLLTGSIPSEFGSLRNLTYIDLGSNRLNGEIPSPLLCNGLTNLKYVDLSNNSLNGTIPLQDHCELPELKYLLLWSNELTGEVPLSLSKSSKLRWLDLESNYLSGELPSTIVSKLPNLQFLQLSYNNFSSHNGNTNLKPFFSSLTNASNLQELTLAGNHLGGELPSVIGNLSTYLVQIQLDGNLISGPIPPELSNFVNLTLLNLANNLLNDSIPNDLCKIPKMERLDLSRNYLSGNIPPCFGGFRHLGLVDLSRNKLSGTIPETLANLTQLRSLLLHGNQLSGKIPASLGNLEILDLSHNRISGEIPREVAGLSSLKIYLNLSSNLLHGSIPLEISKLDMVLAIDLSSNSLSGKIPPQLGSCVALESLNLSGNVFTGNLPESIGRLSSLKALDVSSNQLSGPIPGSLQASLTLRKLNMSYNDFSGNVSNRGAFSILTNDSFRGNLGLCGSVRGMPNCRTRKARHFLIALLLSLLITPIFCIFSCFLFLKSKFKRRLSLVNAKNLDLDEEDQGDYDKEGKFPKISHQQLIEATNGFSQSSLVGSGQYGHVYKGILEDGTKIAAKVLNPAIGGEEISESFKRECQVLKKTRHRNLIRILTICSKPDFKALVFPLMPNGSLEDHLHPFNGVKHQLDLVQWLLSALITDFGISRLVKGGGEDNKFTNDAASVSSSDGLLCGSVGYIAPEYGMGKKASTQGDVYSYGVLLLEIITGKRPTDILFQESSLHEWVKTHYPDKLENIIEDAILRHAPDGVPPENYNNSNIWSDVIVELIEIGLICTQYNPSCRPTMLDVAHVVARLKQYITHPSDFHIQQHIYTGSAHA
ncbi:hypothetical protein LIER_09166 [Lithospermum erythrorhizon]|uniref:Protein kinase domain-containing protein n=1 Tax=Lithospermum erythrorhizon TaxID=34254 RepID=A0AAV3PFR5_LITER